MSEDQPSGTGPQAVAWPGITAMPPRLDLIVNHDRELAEAIRRDDPVRLRGLLARGADAGAGDEVGSTPLHIAASWSARGVAEILLDHGADPHARDREGSTPLHMAAAFGDKAVLGLLLDRGADVNARDDTGWTPLHLAARLGRVEEVGFLLGRGAEAGARDQQGRTPLDVARRNDFLKARWDRLGPLLGDGSRRDGPGPSLPTPGDIAEDDRPRTPGPERGRGRGR